MLSLHSHDIPPLQYEPRLIFQHVMFGSIGLLSHAPRRPLIPEPAPPLALALSRNRSTVLPDPFCAILDESIEPLVRPQCSHSSSRHFFVIELSHAISPLHVSPLQYEQAAGFPACLFESIGLFHTPPPCPLIPEPAPPLALALSRNRSTHAALTPSVLSWMSPRS